MGLLLSWPSLAVAPWHCYAALIPLLLYKTAGMESEEESTIGQRGSPGGVLARCVLPSPLPSCPPCCSTHICACLCGPTQTMESRFPPCHSGAPTKCLQTNAPPVHTIPDGSSWLRWTPREGTFFLPGACAAHSTMGE